MSSNDTESYKSTGPSTGPSSGTTGQSNDSSQSQSSTFDTQPPPSQDETDATPLAWGQLTVIGNNECYELVKDKYNVGRAKECDITLLEKSRPTASSALWKSCSKMHFRIYAETKSTGRYIFLEDLSSNGTLVNDELVGNGKFSVMRSGDIISLVSKTNRAFMFIDFSNNQEQDQKVPQVVRTKYMILSDLGSGACGLVRLAVRKSDCLRVACKCIDKSKFSFSSNSSEKELMKEVSILKGLNHPCIVKVVDVMDTPEMLCIFMELAEAGDLFKQVKTQVRLDVDHAKMVFYQTCLAVKHLHDNNVVHRDLKPENILLSSILPSQQIVKVTDFGYSRIMDTSSLLKTLCGTPLYIAPEIVATQGMGGGYTKAVDCWSLGVILFVCITGQPAFTAERKDLPMKDQILQGNYALKDKYWEYIPEAKDLVSKLLVVDPKKRLTLDEALQHRWFQEDTEMLIKVDKLLNLSNGENTVNDTSCEQDRKRRKVEDAEDRFRQDSGTPLLKNSVSSKAQPDTSAMSISGLSTPTLSNPLMETSILLPQPANMSTTEAP